VPKVLTQYRVFIGSPGGLKEERNCFRRKLKKFTEMHSEPRNVVFQPVGWEETVGGIGRPQELINQDLTQCDYAVFVVHDRWGTPPGGSTYASGVEEEWALAEELYKANKIRNIALFFKEVDARQLRDPGKQLSAVLAFKKRIEEEKRYLFKEFNSIDKFAEALEAHLATRLRDHDSAAAGLSAGSKPDFGSPPFSAPGFAYWIAEAERLLGERLDHNATLFCATKAAAAATSDVEWARATDVLGIAKSRLSRADEAIAAFEAIAERFSSTIEPDRRY
jgi:hypothetical protein